MVKKIPARMQTWATRSLSFAGRATLINSVIFGMYIYLASIFILPNAVLEQLTQVCRNYLWSRYEEYKKSPSSWFNTCLPKKQGGLGFKDFAIWNKASIAKLVRVIAKKKDLL